MVVQRAREVWCRQVCKPSKAGKLEGGRRDQGALGDERGWRQPQATVWSSQPRQLPIRRIVHCVWVASTVGTTTT